MHNNSTDVIRFKNCLMLRCACSVTYFQVKHYVTYECDVIYECRMCRTIFRSLANFILHKRNYCRDSYNPTDHTNCRNKCQVSNFYIIVQVELKSSF